MSMDAECFGGHNGWRQPGTLSCSPRMKALLYRYQTRIISPGYFECAEIKKDNMLLGFAQQFGLENLVF
jgi:hypothetical protein